MDSNIENGHSKTGSLNARREASHGDFLDRMWVRTHAAGWADLVEHELETWGNLPNDVRQHLQKAVHLVRRLYLHSYALDDALTCEARACRAAMGAAADRAARIIELEMEINRLQNVPMKIFCPVCETATFNTDTGHCSNCGSERFGM